ncbi:MAG TPA: TdeIII family type II restriction endonuclease, partial [Rikenellaceae bacterium]|nr:TdeIII family type II restriction endonuclease [Rikenellaceae bacterium]
MGLTVDTKQSIQEYIVNTLRYKFKNYVVGDEVMPFHYRLLGKDRMALFSFIQSINTMFGTSIFEQTAVRLAHDKFKVAKNHVKAFNKISYEAQLTIQSIIDQLSSSKSAPDKPKEIELIKKASNKANLHDISTPLVDVWLETYDDELYLIDIKTVKPNISSFISYKRTLLEWVAVEVAKDENRKIHSLIAMPYNPFVPEPYKSWQLRGMLDLDHELHVGKAFWDFVGGEGAYEDLLDCFETAGI